jgi:hypothetical protein
MAMRRMEDVGTKTIYEAVHDLGVSQDFVADGIGGDYLGA